MLHILCKRVFNAPVCLIAVRTYVRLMLKKKKHKDNVIIIIVVTLLGRVCINSYCNIHMMKIKEEEIVQLLMIIIYF